MKSFRNKTVIVTGGTKGIGKEIAHRFGGLEATVIAAARNVRDVIAGKGSNFKLLYREADVRDLQQMRDLVSLAFNETGRLDLFINNAGVSIWRPLNKVDESFFDMIIETNLKGCFWGCKAAAEVMQPGGSIINIASLAGKRGSANNSVYCASKFGVVGLTQALAKELGARGIRVNSVCPVYVKTDTLFDNLTEDHPEICQESPNEFLDDWAKKNAPLGRLPKATEIADLCVFLASPMASAITGQNINVDCGVLPQ